MKQTPYNYKGRPTGPRLAQELRMHGLKTIPTSRQRKFFCALQHRLKGAGIPLYDENHQKPVSRQAYSRIIAWYIQLCKENGIPLKFCTERVEGQTAPPHDPDDPFD